MARNYGRSKHVEDGGHQREGKGLNFGKPGPTLRGKGFGSGLSREDCMRCPRCKTTGHTRFIQIREDAILADREEKWRLELLCTSCWSKICGKLNDANFPNVIMGKDYSGYQPGLAKYPGDKNAYVTSKRDLDRKVAGRERCQDAQNESQ